MSKKTATLSARVPKSLKNAVIEYVIHGDYINESDFVRQAIREKIFRRVSDIQRKK